MAKVDARGELAPRDVVARAIHAQMAERGDPHVLLDVSHAPAAEVLAHFPNIAAHCAAAGIDITRQPIPVAPAQHYMCGGVQARRPSAPPWTTCSNWRCCMGCWLQGSACWAWYRNAC